jgi:archaellum component FlaC
MDAYERLMDRYMSLVEGSLTNMGTDVGGVVKKLNSIERKIDNLGTRIGRIEKALNIPQPKPKKKAAAQKPKE